MSENTDYERRLAEVTLMAEEVFGSPEKAQKSLKSKNPALGAAPVNYLSTDTELQTVKKVLNAISSGGVV